MLLDTLSKRISLAQESLADPEQRKSGERAINLIHSAACTGRDVTLTPRQVRVLSRLIDGAQASHQARSLTAVQADPASKITPFPSAS